MNLDEIKVLGVRLAERCRKHGIAELAVFGSAARGDAGPDGDVGPLYVRAPGNDLGMAYFDLQEDLERLFGRRVDLVAKDGPGIRCWLTRRSWKRLEELCPADLVDNARAVRWYLDGVTRERWDADGILCDAVASSACSSSMRLVAGAAGAQ